MNHQIARLLNAKARSVGVYMSSSRDKNVNKETFTLHRVIPLSEHTAAVIYHKSSNKYALCLMYWRDHNGSEGEWMWQFVTESHVHGMAKLGPILQEVEKHNYPVNLK